MKPYIPILMVLLLVSSSYIGVSNTAIESDEDMEQPMQTSSPPMDSPWPMKCHDIHHTSRSPYSTENITGLEKWRFRSEKDGGMESSAVIDDDGIIYFGTMGSDHKLYALYPNGTKKWSYEVGLMIWSTPAIAEYGTIYVGSWDDYLHAIYPNGTRKWKFYADDISSSPAIAEDGTIYFGAMGPGDIGRIYAVKPNGTEKWHYDTGYWIVSDPAIGDDGTIYIGSGDTYLYAMNPNGTLKWRFKTGDWIKGHPSIAEDETIYIPSMDGYLYALYSNGTMKWKVKTGYGAISSAAISDDGTVYISTTKLYAIYPDNGTVKWSIDVGGDNSHPSPAISADGTIYVSTGTGKHLVAVNPDGTEKWRKELCNLHARSSPCIGEDGTIYVGSTWTYDQRFWFGYLHAIGRGELQADANGPYYGLIDEPEHITGSAQGGYPPYTWHWDFGDGNTSNEQNPAHTYSSPGNYTVTLTVTDDTGNISENITWAKIKESNNPPDKPAITGETSGKAGKKYDYDFMSVDPDSDEWVWYYIDWDDDSFEDWIGPYKPEKVVTVSHMWSQKDTYIIRAKARDNYGGESEWGELEVTMPKNKQSTNWWFLQFLEQHPKMFPILRHLVGL